MRTSIPEEIDQIRISSGLPVEAGCMCDCEQSVRIFLTISLNSNDHRSVLRYQVLNIDRCRFDLSLASVHADFISYIFQILYAIYHVIDLRVG